MCNEASNVFKQLSKHPPTVRDDDFEILEKIVVIMYDRSSNAACVNDT